MKRLIKWLLAAAWAFFLFSTWLNQLYLLGMFLLLATVVVYIIWELAFNRPPKEPRSEEPPG